MSSGPRDSNIGVASAAPRTENDRSSIGWLKRIAELLNGIGGGTAGDPSSSVTSVQGIDGGTPLSITTPSAVSAISFARTADTAAYIANDVIGIDNAGSAGAATLLFSGVTDDDGGEFLITSTSLEIDITSVPSGMTSFRLYLYNGAPPSALVDNNPWDLASNDRSSFLGYVDLGTPVDLGSTLYVEVNSQNKQFTVNSGGDIYGYLVTAGAYTPASGSTYKVVLHGITI